MNDVRKMRVSCRNGMVLAVFAIAVTTVALRTQPQEKKSGGTGPGAPAAQAEGRRIFSTTCAACHGLDGHGSERAPDILARPDFQRMTQEEIVSVIRDGVPTKRMPAFGGMLEAAQIRVAAAYLHGLMHGRTNAAPLPGDPVEGRVLFFGKAGCNECHMVAGSGGFLAGDLSVFGRLHSVEDIRNAITDPAKNPVRGEQEVTVLTNEGDQFTGLARNEDNFSIQVQSADGAFHLLMKADLAKIQFLDRPLMPADYSLKLSEKELDDIVSYLMRTAQTNSKSGEAPATDDDKD